MLGTGFKRANRGLGLDNVLFAFLPIPRTWPQTTHQVSHPHYPLGNLGLALAPEENRDTAVKDDV